MRKENEKVIGYKRIYIGKNRGVYATLCNIVSQYSREEKISDDPDAKIDTQIPEA